MEVRLLRSSRSFSRYLGRVVPRVPKEQLALRAPAGLAEAITELHAQEILT